MFKGTLLEAIRSTGDMELLAGPKKDSSMGLVIGGLVLILIVCCCYSGMSMSGIIGYYVYQKRNKDNADKEKEDTEE